MNARTVAAIPSDPTPEIGVRRFPVVTLISLAATACFFIAMSLSSRAVVNAGRPVDPERCDPALYRAEAERVQRGEGYYEAAAAELVARGYPTQSIFNWRTPLPMWLIGKLPSLAWGKVILNALGVVLLFLTFEAVAREGRIARAVAAALFMTGPVLLNLQGDYYLMPVFWASMLIALSVCCFGIDRPTLGVALGISALFCRELALGYCVASLVLAGWHRRGREAALWCGGIVAWCGFMAWHAAQVAPLVEADAVAHDGGWLGMHGAGLLLAMTQVNAYLVLWPQWIAAVFLTVALFGFAGWNTPMGQRAGLTACGYLASFAIVGQPFNQYWGAMFGPLLCLGAGHGCGLLRQTWAAACNASVDRQEAAVVRG